MKKSLPLKKSLPFDARVLDRLINAILDVRTGKTRRAELHAEFDGSSYLLVVYHVNEYCPVRVDFKVKRNAK